VLVSAYIYKHTVDEHVAAAAPALRALGRPRVEEKTVGTHLAPKSRVATAAVSVTISPGVTPPAAGAFAVARGAAVKHVREGREAPRTRAEEHCWQRGGVERAERERVAGFAGFLARGHLNRVAHL